MLSKGGRLTLLQSTLWSLPIYYMSLFTIPASVAIQLEKIMRDFLWSKHARVNDFHWVSGDEICRPKEDGGLGILLLRVMNEALKTKWLWRYAKEEDALWKKVIVFKYGTNTFCWWSKRSPYVYVVSYWNSIHAGLDFFSLFLWFILRLEVGLGCCFGMIFGVRSNLVKFNFPMLFGWLI